ncbi:hypothetical protein CUMW_243870 [Citrus unshiu]|uniref:Disease resistance protein At4g27190-like leucine-rich repeats domain-containing protein n=1 Tax=Citrus unshiu TaxID=55188 RepID=A0A2H5QNG2_CITUN|nr:hypothetical protein CUMW_243870 [Citrus unshiu]
MQALKLRACIYRQNFAKKVKKAVGIPHGDYHKGCKVLLTARSIDTLSKKMDSQQNFLIGDYVEGSELKWVARDVAKECADALEQLRRPSSTNFMNIQPAAYKAIKLSYDKLAGEELKNTFLLIGYTAIASIDDLLMCGMGLGLFQGVSKMEVARARVHALVHKLKASCMLLNHISQKKELFSMHDVVRDVAISIASTEQNVFSATNEQVEGYREWSDESAIKLYTSIVLHDIRTNLLPELVESPQLKLLVICADQESSSLTIPNKFFERMMQVFPNLEELIVDAKHIITNTCLFSEDLLCKLKCLHVESDDESTTMLSLDDFLQRFHTMKVVQIGGHPKRFSKEKAENGMKVIIRDANKYCDLKHILKQESSITNNLVILRVSSCQHLINLVPSWTTFQNLTTLAVSHCGRLKNLLTSSIAKTLVRLREMTIQSCVMITEIIVADDNVAAKDEVVAFSKLKELKLLYLESLTSFCSSNCALKFPSLEILLVHECPNMKIFSEGELSTPKLHKVQLWYEACWFWKGDLNKTIQQVHTNQQSAFSLSCFFSLQTPNLISSSCSCPQSQTKLGSFPALVAGVWSDDNILQLEATTLFRKLLSFDRNPPIEKVIQSGVVPRFVEFLMRGPCVVLIFLMIYKVAGEY